MNLKQAHRLALREPTHYLGIEITKKCFKFLRKISLDLDFFTFEFQVLLISRSPNYKILILNSHFNASHNDKRNKANRLELVLAKILRTIQ
jgi:hypothetical protein